MVGKVYFLPHVRARAMGLSQADIVNACMSQLKVGSSWDLVLSHIDSYQQDVKPYPDMLAVDCLEPSKNRVKVYFRTHSTSFNAIVHLMTLGGKLTGPSILETVSTIRCLWSLFFPGVDPDKPLTPKRPEHCPLGFLIYFEMSLGRLTPIPKVYIPVRHYCDNDAQVAHALSEYYATINQDFGKRYISDLRRLL